MKIIYTALAFILITATSLFAQAPSVKWQKCLGGLRDDYGHSMIKTSDGGYILAGETYSYDGDVQGNHPNGHSDFWIVKLTSLGNIEWQKCLGGYEEDGAYSIVQTSDGGYAIAGYTQSDSGDVSGSHGYTDMWVVKISSSGSIEWQKCLGGSYLDHAYSIIQTFDGGYAIAGETYSDDGDVAGFHTNSGLSPDAWVVKLTNEGEFEWQNPLGGGGMEKAESIIQLPDSSFILVGTANSNNDGDVSGRHGGNTDGWVVKLSSKGTVVWQKCVGGYDSDYLYSIIAATDSGYIVAGASNSFSTSSSLSDFWVLKLDDNGSTIWQNVISGTGSISASVITRSFDGGYLVAGSTSSNDSIITGNHGGWDILLAKLTSDGKNVWHKCYGGSSTEGSFGVVQNDNGSIFLAGGTNSKDGNGDVSGRHGVTSNYDFWIAELTTPESVDNTLSPIHTLSLSTYPNPASRKITLRYVHPTISSDVVISITDINGKQAGEIRQANVMQGSNEVTLDVSELSEGTYYVTISADGLSETTSVQVVK